MPALDGRTLGGRYRLEAKIASGGMSTVYVALDTTLERHVAIKLMHRDVAADSDQIERFGREARAVAQLSHPHIVGVIDAGEDDGHPYIVLEHVEGETLKDRIRREGRLPIDEALAYAIEIARALGAAHARGIVHRDVKPQNVLIGPEGSAKVTDFGIARTLDEEGLTVDGRVLGTTDYVSPEQAMGHEVTRQSDLYSLGIVLYEMLTGELPFTGESQVAVAMKHVREQLPDVQRRRPEVSAALAAVIDKLTAKQLPRRYSDDAELISDLGEVLAIEAARSGQATGEATTVLRTLPKRARRRIPLRLRHPAWLALLAILLVAGGVVAAVQLADRAERGTGAQAGSTPPETSPVSLAQDAAAAFDPQGDRKEHDSDTANVLDRDPNTTWATEDYRGGTLSSVGKDGVGIYVDAEPGVDAKALEVTNDPEEGETGWRGRVYAADGALPDSLDGWRPVSEEMVVSEERARFDLDTAGRAFRYYLLWITELPPDANRVRIAEVQLLR